MDYPMGSYRSSRIGSDRIASHFISSHFTSLKTSRSASQSALLDLDASLAFTFHSSLFTPCCR